MVTAGERGAHLVNESGPTLEAAVAAGEAEVGLVCTTYRVWEFDDEGWLSGPVATGP